MQSLIHQMLILRPAAPARHRNFGGPDPHAHRPTTIYPLQHSTTSALSGLQPGQLFRNHGNVSVGGNPYGLFLLVT